jgi:hypothetical protein
MEGGHAHGSVRLKCEACGLTGGTYTYVHTTNGGLNLCQQCLAEINGKNPEVKRLRSLTNELAAAIWEILNNPGGCAFCDSGSLRRRVDGREAFHADDCPFMKASELLTRAT